MANNQESRVLDLIGNCSIKCEWQTIAHFDGKAIADSRISKKHSIPVSVVRLARFYW